MICTTVPLSFKATEFAAGGTEAASRMKSNRKNKRLSVTALMSAIIAYDVIPTPFRINNAAEWTLKQTPYSMMPALSDHAQPARCRHGPY
jgi:hypothetical protein